MAASKDEVNRKLTFRKYEDGVHRWRSQGENIFNEDTTYQCPTYVHRTPPCQGSCPSGEDVRGWLNIVRGIELPPQGVSMQEYAFRRSTDANPFPSMMGRVCPAPCEHSCVLNIEKEPVTIRENEAAIVERAFAEGYIKPAPPKIRSGKKVAVIGSGPAGMAAADQLNKAGHTVTLFDGADEIGGQFNIAKQIPGKEEFFETLRYYKRRLEVTGVRVRLGVRVSADELLAEDFDEVILATGIVPRTPNLHFFPASRDYRTHNTAPDP